MDRRSIDNHNSDHIPFESFQKWEEMELENSEWREIFYQLSL